MLRIFLCSAFIFLVIFISPGYCWQIETFGNDHTGTSTSIALDANNEVYISFFKNHQDPNNCLEIAHYNGVAWDYEIIESSFGWYSSNSLCIDKNNNPCIAYCDSYRHLKYAYKIGSAWHIETVDSAGDVGYNCSMTIDNKGYIHIAYDDLTNYTIKYAYKDQTTWHLSVIDNTCASWLLPNPKMSIKTDSNNRPQVLYTVNMPNNFKYAKWNGSTWIKTNIESWTDAGIFGLSLAIDSKDHPHISYYGQSSLKYGFNNGISWQISIIDTVAGGWTGVSPSIVLDIDDNPHISYNQETFSSLKYTHRVEDRWLISVVPDSAPSLYEKTTLCLDTYNQPHIAFSINQDVKAAYAHHNQVGVELAYFTAQPASAGGIRIGWQISSPMQGIIGFNLYRATQSKLTRSDWAKLNSTLITGSNPYTFIDSSARLGAGYTYKLTSMSAAGREDDIGTTTNSTQETPTQFVITSVHPNPVASLLTCSYIQPTTGEVTFTIFDLSGRIALISKRDLQTGEGNAVLDVGSLANGIYILNATVGTHFIARRFVVNK